MRPKGVSRGVGAGQTTPIRGYIHDISYMSCPLPLRVVKCPIRFGCYDHAQLRVLSGYSGRIAAL